MAPLRDSQPVSGGARSHYAASQEKKHLGLINPKVCMAVISWEKVGYTAREGRIGAFGRVGNLFFLKLETGYMGIC